MHEMKRPKRLFNMKNCSSTVKSKIVSNLNPTCHAGQQLTLKGKFLITQNRRKPIPGKLISVQIYSGTEVDPSKCTFYTLKHVIILFNQIQKILIFPFQV